MTVDEVLFDEAAAGAGRRVRGGVRRSGRGGPGLAVQRADGRPAIALNSGVTLGAADVLGATRTSSSSRRPTSRAARRAPTTRSCATAATSSGYVLSGTLRVVVGFDEFVLEPGDSITFPSSTPHRLSNDGTETVRAIWVVRGRRGRARTSRRPRRAGAPATIGSDPMSGRALVVGVTGISGGNVAQRLLADGWEVAGLCRRPDGLDERITPLAADLEDAEAVAAAVRGTRADARLLHDLVAPRDRGRELRRQRRACCRTCSTRPPPRSPCATSRSSPGSSTTSGRSRRTPRPSRTRRSPRSRRACRTRTSTTCRRTSSSRRPSATASPGRCTGRTR